MGQIMKLYTALFLMLIMAVSAMGIVTAQVRLIQVQNLHKSIVAEVKGSNCDRTVIESCFDRAQNTECSLIISVCSLSNLFFRFHTTTLTEACSNELKQHHL